MDIVGNNLEAATSTSSSDSSTSSNPSSGDRPTKLQGQRGSLPRSTPLQVLHNQQIDQDGDDSIQMPAVADDSLASANQNEVLIRSPWTPPPTPGLGFSSVFAGVSAAVDELEALGAGLGLPTYNGRRSVVPTQMNDISQVLTLYSPYSSKSNPVVGERVLSSITLPELTGDLGHPRGRSRQSSIHNLAYQTEDMYDVGLCLPFNPDVYSAACNTELPRPSMEEELYFADSSADIEDDEEKDGLYGDAMLDVTDVVALTEEAVEAGTVEVAALV